jgi:plasmid stabilization system protein ParE
LTATFTPLAEEDLKQAYLFYEANDPALAMKLVMAVRQTVDAIEAAPLVHRSHS